MPEVEEVLVYPTQPTDYLPHVIRRCVEKSATQGLPVRFTLLGAEVTVRPGQSAAEVDHEVQRQWRQGQASLREGAAWSEPG